MLLDRLHAHPRVGLRQHLQKHLRPDRRVGFRVIPGLSERVIFRELFPSGLTLLDKGHLGELGVSHIAARQELREMVAGLALPERSGVGSMDLIGAA